MCDPAARMFWRNVKARSTPQADATNPTVLNLPRSAAPGTASRHLHPSHYCAAVAGLSRCAACDSESCILVFLRFQIATVAGSNCVA